ASFRFDRLQSDEPDCAVSAGIQSRLLGNSRCRAADVEGTHRELRSGLADRLSCDYSRCLTEFDQPARSEITSVAHDANAALRFASQHGTDLHPLDTGSLNCARQLFGDFLVDIDDQVAIVVLDFFE